MQFISACYAISLFVLGSIKQQTSKPDQADDG
ncbi:Uncharacterised protein [Serratia quinivorans]|nr:Uncharacterised protein [Serratia quinivorans]CAI1509844.1 Uncharacterised protein [Serratia quinivorans]